MGKGELPTAYDLRPATDMHTFASKQDGSLRYTFSATDMSTLPPTCTKDTLWHIVYYLRPTTYYLYVCVWVCVVGSSPRLVVVGLGRASVGRVGVGSNRVGSGRLRVEL